MGQARRSLALLGAVALLAGAVGCGDDDDEGENGETATTEEAAATEITVTADEYSFELSEPPTTETETITFDNQGKEAHALVFGKVGEGFTLDEAVELGGRQGSAVTYADGGAGPGESSTIKVKEPIESGDFVMLCPIEGPEGVHYELGQLIEGSIE